MHSFFCSNFLIYVFMWRSKEKSLQVTRTRDDGPETLTLLNNELNSFTLRYVFGTTPFFPAAFSASHQPSSLKCTRNKKFKYKIKNSLLRKSCHTKVISWPKEPCLVKAFFKSSPPSIQGCGLNASKTMTLLFNFRNKYKYELRERSCSYVILTKC